MPVIAAVDRTNRDTPVITHARDLAAALGEELHVVHVLDRGEFMSLESGSVERTGRPVEMNRAREVAADIATEVAEAVTDAFTPVGLVGNVARSVHDYAADHDASFIVVGGRKHSPLGKALFGSVTQSLLLDADRPVVVVPSPK